MPVPFPQTDLGPNHAAAGPKRTPRRRVAPSQRTVLIRLMHETASGHLDWQYRELRPLSLPALGPHGQVPYRVTADCSWGVKLLCKWAGLPDPTDRKYDGYGNSVSIFHALPHIALAKAKAGDILLFGPEGEWHATMILEPGPDPLLWSMGHQGAPNLYRLSADTRRPITICQVKA